MALLEVKNVTKRFGGLTALNNVSFSIDEGEICGLIGPNGAGKSTTLRAISGLCKPSSGEIHFDGQRIDGLSPDRIVKLGIAHVPEGRRVFNGLTLRENLYLGAFTRTDKDGIERDLESVYAHFPQLRERQDQQANTMSGGEQQMLAIGRALMSNPRVLLLDEPSLGLAPVIVQEIVRMLAEINSKGVSIVLVEQNAELALKLAQRGYVLETGNIALQGEARSLMNNEHVRRAHLGI